jgi:hypothetical protein
MGNVARTVNIVRSAGGEHRSRSDTNAGRSGRLSQPHSYGVQLVFAGPAGVLRTAVTQQRVQTDDLPSSTDDCKAYEFKRRIEREIGWRRRHEKADSDTCDNFWHHGFHAGRYINARASADLPTKMPSELP